MCDLLDTLSLDTRSAIRKWFYYPHQRVLLSITCKFLLAEDGAW